MVVYSRKKYYTYIILLALASMYNSHILLWLATIKKIFMIIINNLLSFYPL